MLTVDFSNRQSVLCIDTQAWRVLLQELFAAEGFHRGEVSISIVSDPEMHELNRAYLNHDYPTDVLSFVFDRENEELTGEIIVSADTAIARCVEFGWQADQEATLYLIHGALHLVGYEDKSESDQRVMRERESHYLERHGIKPSGTGTAGNKCQTAGGLSTPSSRSSTGA